MKPRLLTFMMLMFAYSTNLMATNPVTSTSMQVSANGFEMKIQKANNGIQKTWLGKKFSKVSNKIANKLAKMDFNDSRTWVKIFIIVCALGLLLILLGAVASIFANLGYLLLLVGFIAGVVWLVRSLI